MRLLFLPERFPPDRGGVSQSAGRQVAALAPHLARLDVLRLADDLPPGRVASESREGWTLYRAGRAATPEESLQILHETAVHLVGAASHDAVLGFFAVPAGYVAVTVARRCGIRSIVSLRGNDVDRAMFHGPRLPLLLHALERADSIVGVSGEILAKVTALTGRTAGLHLVPNGVDVAALDPEGGVADLVAARPFLGFPGELRLKKGLPVLLELAERLAAGDPGTIFAIGGVRVEERDGVEAWRRAHPAASTRLVEIRYTRDRAELATTLRAMDLLVFPSLWDGLPNALLEGMALARPVLASAVGAIPEVLEHGVNGFLIAPSRLDTFAAEALRVAGLPADERARVGRAARETVATRFRPEAERDALLAVLSSR